MQHAKSPFYFHYLFHLETSQRSTEENKTYVKQQTVLTLAGNFVFM